MKLNNSFYSLTQRVIFTVIFVLFSMSAVFAFEKIVFSKLTGSFWQLWIMDSNGANQRQITFSKEDKRNPFWIGKEQRLGYRTSNGELFSIDLNGAQKEELLSKFKPIINPDYAEKTNELIFVRFHPAAIDVGDIWKVNLETLDSSVLTNDGYSSFQPKSTDDGKKVVFMKLDIQRDHQIWIMDGNGDNQKQLTHGRSRHDLPAISHDQQRVIFSSNDETGDFDLFEIDLMTNVVKRFFGKIGMDTSPRFSLDDQKIVFVSNSSGQKQIWIVDASGKNLRQLTFDASSIDPAWIEVKEK